MSRLRLDDKDTGESAITFVGVPEGLSIQSYYTRADDYISTIINDQDIDYLIEFLQEYRFAKNHPQGQHKEDEL